MNFCKRRYQLILRYLYTEVKKRRGEISLHKHFKIRLVATCHLQTCSKLLKKLTRSLWITSFDNQLATSLLTNFQQTCRQQAVASWYQLVDNKSVARLLTTSTNL